jgi:hypothetical protein
LAGVAALVLASCGGGGQQSSVDSEPAKRATTTVETKPEAVNQQPLWQAAATTLEADSARSALSLSFEGGSSEVASVLGGMSISAEGESNFKTGDGSMSMDMSALAKAAGGILGTADDLVFEIRSVDHVAYMRFPAFMAQVFDVDTPWVSVDAAKVFNDETLSQLNGQADPTAYIQMLAYASDDVAKVGTDDVRGELTTHYHATVDLGRLAEREKNEMPLALQRRLEDHPELSGQFGALVKLLGNIDADTDVWVDGQHRLRKMTMHLDMAQFAAKLGAPAGDVGDLGMDLTFERHDYGVEVHVEAPPASEVTDVSNKLGALTRGGVGTG